MNSRVDNFIIRQPDGTRRFSNSLVLGGGVEVTDTVGGIPELRGAAFTGARVWPDLPFDLGSGGDQVVEHGEVDLDSRGFFDNSVSSSRLTVPAGAAGVYLVVAQGVFLGGNQSTRATSVLLNGTHRVAVARLEQGGGPVTVTATQILALNEGDYLEMALYQDSGTTISVVASAETIFMITRLGA